MTAAHIKALCRDFAIDRLPIDTRVDIQIAIARLCKDPIMLEYLRYFVLYLAGFRIEEIAERLHMGEYTIQQALSQFITALAETSGYTDDYIVRRVPKKKQIQVIEQLKGFTHDFTT